MTRREFKEAMKRGLGRCILELDHTEDVEKYREIVLWGCTHNLSYDTQCEGTRAWYVRELVRRFCEEKPFVDAVIQKLSRYRSNGGWEFSHYCELLGRFAWDGNREALTALRRKHAELYEILKRKRKRRKNGVFSECDDFESLCIELIDIAANPIGTYIKIVEDIGALMLENPLLEQSSFEWLVMHCEQTYGKENVGQSLAERAEASPAVKRFLDGASAWDSIVSGKERRQPVPRTTEEILKLFDEERDGERDSEAMIRKVRISAARIRAWVKRTGDTEVLSVLAQRYFGEQDPLERAKLLFAFGRDCPFPMPPDSLIRDAGSGNQILKEAAFYALEHMRHEKIRQFALELAAKGECISEAVSLLANHYQKEDRELFVRLVKKIPVTYEDKEGWHGAYSSVLDLMKTKGVKAAPKELLPYLYEHTLCSFCRAYIVKEMGRRHMMTEELLQECLYDSNDEIRSYAGKRLKK